MKRLLLQLPLLIASIAIVQAQTTFQINPLSTTTPFSIVRTPAVVAAWNTYAVLAIANGTNGCANANGCWQVNGVLGANKAAGVTQALTLAALPANGYVEAFRIKSSTACTGTTTLRAGLGTTGTPDLFMVSASTGYSLIAAVSNTNITTANPLVQGSDTVAATNLVVNLTSTGSNIDQLAAGCAFTVSALIGILP